MDRTIDKNGNEIFLENWEDIKFIPKVLTKQQCDDLIKDADFENTPNNIPNYEPDTLIERRKIVHHELVKLLSDRYSWDVTHSPILWYKPGVSNEPHADSFAYLGRDENQDNIVERIMPWKRTAVIFLNDDFDAGELVFPKFGVTIKPKTGNMVLSSGGYEFLHYTEAASKDRYVLVVRINN